ncbi:MULTISPECIES: tRNA uridine-5-carboxymethylaminomethyl(34) synthesis GTPase MnmE [Psychrilyobacter]|uniref:tRNA modification GTPase MnmE n=1 Tax=Psychrilyobacter piezotolerans TaxID=2293438 RepID=A0ABX9KEJ4_9FUSO|nr:MULTISPECIES: tRNA uridine-5-carboxymethylaminomethyl(34) synthesis GTPase MnmE [Psychrilyobacter]MCS5420799.1 tRNA uridine-5-carboxymethylaminomethyl(34) synthesis GTPase MnmE [Psychrilyobacter sp. S5]NDI78912.1 tRNA uridine-5-carboxymethylaminomethyl(34) synthesis GTPase MnmE [Psychrilyobacter piezotolerans]RDE59797.1 tRNA uridine-5-carboxymethylaminomethyl(34) synthesis GTPase MnmE [Psychrilyobacter sp. S5]REI40123.1 tRNA uridine-5-carboxymethylaminomethyl(34) synthesis GTPase MnmE [Psych
MFDTIAAISTPRGEGGIGIVRMSGEDSINILSKIFRPISKKKVEELKNFTINYGHLYSGVNLVDEVMVSIMKGPKTYTKEDIVEINCHGGYLMTEKVLELVLSNGARIAEQGEFTRRAFMNGRLDLTQAEAVIDLIHGKTERSLSLSLDQLRGDLKDQILHLKKLLLDVVAHINVVLDYPEEGIDDPLPEGLVGNLKEVLETSDRLSASYNQGKMIKEGVKTAIVGKPNVGKSSLLNSLLKEERAIVTHIPGTTRDVIEEIINIKGIPLILADTAGIRNTDDFIENIGVEKSEKLLNDADLILFVVDGSRELSEEDLRVHNSIHSEKVVGILNKIDIEQKIDLSKLDKVGRWIEISAKENIGIAKMEEEIYSYIVSGKVEDSSQTLVITNIRHRSALVKTKEAIENIFETINMGLPMDLIAVDLKEALDALSEVTGEISSEDVLDHIFSNFCVGK